MSVPKTAMNEDRCVAGREDDVGPARQIATIDSKSEPQPVCDASNRKFRSRAGVSHSRHL